ncbi:MAG TPA: 4Fe-4S ferredoxin [Methylococcaceae bacterium]|jgi:ferredoxin|nr:4Fe-4S ferredoxin [Methylococcaceae bacterium]HIN68187.1 4Fe-4S ferredoxin [Methylococcales bacterium]HIA44722.1 4Fe-4S ferredoxin [Methylococcaceae bacterium]HIB62422.1 4Fe-4S ferredoxin [Methylococcaceae bacterium]HIO12535.1 4Fe-4S ferredoxin [Methylococcales bacterium]
MINSPVELAQQAVDQCIVEAAPYVTFESEGSLLVIGAIPEVLESLSLLNAFSVSVLCVGSYTSQERARLPEEVNLIETVVNLQLSGYLGNFTVTGVATSFDLVLDLRQGVGLQSILSPIGYFQLTAIGELSLVVEQLNDLIGVFDKPKYFSYLKDKCAHSRNQIEGCRQCIEICSADAITSVDFQIVVNPYLCQGCGDCSVVCPSGAMNYQYPSRQDTLNQLRSMLTAFYAAGGVHPIVVFCNEEERGVLTSNLNDYLLFPLESLSSVGAEVWLAALAFGAGLVVLYNSAPLLASSELALNNEVEVTRAILAGMGFSEKLLYRSEGVLVQNTEAEFLTIPPATFASDNDKRTVFRLAVDHLFNFAIQQPIQVKLTGNTAWGEVKVARDLCTLCFSCVSACPSGALQSGQNSPQLNFIESLCLQCNLCVSTCPEQAVALSARYVFDSVGTRSARRLHEELAFHCIHCQKPFATEKMITVMKEKLSGHPMFQGEALKRLEMCEDCRIKNQFG